MHAKNAFPNGRSCWLFGIWPVRCCFDHTSRHRHRSFFFDWILATIIQLKKLMFFEARLIVYCIVHLSTSFWRSSATARNKKNGTRIVRHNEPFYHRSWSCYVAMSLHTSTYFSKWNKRKMNIKSQLCGHVTGPIRFGVDIVPTRSSLLNHMPWLAHTIGSEPGLASYSYLGPIHQ